MYRCDKSERQPDGAKLFYSEWLGGPTLAKIENCRIAYLEGEMRRTVTITGEADGFYSIPAHTSIGGKQVRGYVTNDEGNFVFRHRITP